MEEEALRSKLESLSSARAPRLVPKPDGGLARVCHCYDGDTITLLCYVSAVPARLSLRVRGVDAPERRGRGAAEARCADLVKDVVERLLLNRVVRVDVVGLDKYGRCLGDVLLPGLDQSLSAYLLEQGLARPYDGEARAAFSEAELERISAVADGLCAALPCR